MSETERIKAERDALKEQMEQGEIARHFQNSRMVREGFTAPPAMIEATFRKHFVVENGAVVARDAAGNTILASDFSGPAKFDEALRALVDRCGYGDRILKATGASGSGAVQSAPARSARSLPRAAFAGLSPADQMAHVKAGGTVTD